MKEGFAAAQGRRMVVVLSTEITEELRRDGWVREFIRCVQEMRKELGLAYDARIEVAVFTKDGPLAEVIEINSPAISSEILADAITLTESQPENKRDYTIDEIEVAVSVNPR